MPNWKEEETLRGILTDEKIKQDIRQEARTPLLLGLLLIPILLLLGLVCYGMLSGLGESPVLFWFLAVLLGSIGILCLSADLLLLAQGIRGFRSAGSGGFSVAADHLQDRGEGRKSETAFLIFKPWIRDLIYPEKPYRFTFSRGVYSAAARTRQFPHSGLFSTDTESLFHHGEIGAPWWVATGKSGKILRIYPADMFDYRGSTPT